MVHNSYLATKVKPPEMKNLGYQINMAAKLPTAKTYFFYLQPNPNPKSKLKI